MIRNLIWDLDGTLFDTYPAFIRGFSRALESFGLAVLDAEIEPLARVSLPYCAQEMSKHYGLDQEKLIDHFLEYYREIPQAEQPPFEGVKEVRDYISSIDGVNVIVTHRRRATTEELLETHQMSDLFIDIVAGDDGYPEKPDPASFLMLMGKYGLKPDETAAVGDRDIDFHAGKEAGLITCMFGSELPGSNPDLDFWEYGDLLRYLKAS